MMAPSRYVDGSAWFVTVVEHVPVVPSHTGVPGAVEFKMLCVKTPVPVMVGSIPASAMRESPSARFTSA